MKIKALLSVAATLVLGTTTLLADKYVVDPSHSNIGFKVKHLMISNVTGNFSSFQGSYEIEDGKLTMLEGTVDVATIDTGIEKRDNHLKSADFFLSAKFPHITFKMKEFKGDKVTGDLTIRDVTKTVTLDAEVSQAIKDPWGNMRTAMTLEGKINREDFGLTWNKALETGGVVVGETVKLEIELEGISK